MNQARQLGFNVCVGFGEVVGPLAIAIKSLKWIE